MRQFVNDFISENIQLYKVTKSESKLKNSNKNWIVLRIEKQNFEQTDDCKKMASFSSRRYKELHQMINLTKHVCLNDLTCTMYILKN